MKPYVWSPWRTARTAADRAAVIAGDERCTFAELTARADALGGGLRAAGLPDGAVVSTDILPGPRFFALALAALRHGFCLFPLHPALFPSGTGAALQADMKTALHVTATEAPPDGPVPSPCPTRTDASLLDDAAADPPPAPPRAGCLAFATSGTTGEPKAVPRARPALPYRGVAVHPRYAAGDAFGPHIMANPTFHLGTLGTSLYALQAGSTVVVQPSWSTAGFVELVDRYAADSAFLSLDLLVDLVIAGQAPSRPLRALFHGGAACPPALKRTAIDLLGPVLHEYYGTSKSTATEITSEEWLRRPGSVGRPLPGIEIVVVDDEGRALGPRTTGRIRLRLRPADRAPDDPELCDTGDVGFVDDDGYLFVVGRESSPQDGGLDVEHLEYQIRLLPGVADVVVTGGTVPVCYVETLPGHREGAARDIGVAARLLDLPEPVLRLAAAGTLPRTPSGKVRRAALDAWWDAHGQPA